MLLKLKCYQTYNVLKIKIKIHENGTDHLGLVSTYKNTFIWTFRHHQGESIKETNTWHKDLKAQEQKAATTEFKAKLTELPEQCDMCDFSCMEKNNMKKHVNSKHAEQK